MGYLDGGTGVDPSDPARVARHLTGREPLSGDALQRADLDEDGDVEVEDLFLLHAARHGQLLLPAAAPRIDGPGVGFIRPGGPFRLDAFNVGADLAAMAVHVVMAGMRAEVPILAATPLTDAGGDPWATELLCEAPPSLARPDDGDRVARLFLTHRGMHSNMLAVTVIDAPRIDLIERGDPGSDALLTIRGDGFDSHGAPVVRFDGTDVAPESATATALTVAPPPGIGTEAAVFVVSGGRRSNPAIYSPLAVQEGQVALPPGSPLAASSLSITAPNGGSFPVAADGAFAAQAERTPLGAFEAVDGANRIILMAYRRSEPAPLLLDARSTAIALIFEGVRRTTDDHAACQILLGTIIPALPQCAALEAALLAGHAARPVLADQIEHDTQLRAALRDARIAAAAARAGTGG